LGHETCRSEPIVPSHFPSRPNVRYAEIYGVDPCDRLWPN